MESTRDFRVPVRRTEKTQKNVTPKVAKFAADCSGTFLRLAKPPGPKNVSGLTAGSLAFPDSREFGRIRMSPLKRRSLGIQKSRNEDPFP